MVFSNLRPFTNNKSLLAAFAIVASMAFALPSEAALLDWLFPRRRAVSRQYYVLPTSPANSAYTSYYGGWSPSTTPYAWYAPQTQYRNMWTQVPVTSYRPVGQNALRPCTTYSWQTQRVPVTTFQPTLGTVASQPACGCDANTSYYGTTPAYSNWQTVAPSEGNLFGYRSAADFAPTISGYAPYNSSAVGTGTTLDYANATPWTSADNSFAQTSGATEWTTVPGNGSNAATNFQDGDDVPGATPWKPVDGDSSSRGLEPSPADRIPSFRPDYDSSPATRSRYDEEAEYERYRRFRERYEEDMRRDRERYEQRRPQIDSYDSGSSTTQTQYLRPDRSTYQRPTYVPPAEQFVPFQRPIPDPDRGNSWDFDDKFQLRDRPMRSARRDTKVRNVRWRAIPIDNSTDRSRAAQLDSLRNPALINEGGWRSQGR